MKLLLLVPLTVQILDRDDWQPLTLKGTITTLGMFEQSTVTNKHLDLSHTDVKLCLIMPSDSCNATPLTPLIF